MCAHDVLRIGRYIAMRVNHQLADILARRMQRIKDEQDSEDVDAVEEAVENTESIPSNSTPPSSPPLIQARTEYDVGSVSYCCFSCNIHVL